MKKKLSIMLVATLTLSCSNLFAQNGSPYDSSILEVNEDESSSSLQSVINGNPTLKDAIQSAKDAKENWVKAELDLYDKVYYGKSDMYRGSMGKEAREQLAEDLEKIDFERLFEKVLDDWIFAGTTFDVSMPIAREYDKIVATIQPVTENEDTYSQSDIINAINTAKIRWIGLETAYNKALSAVPQLYRAKMTNAVGSKSLYHLIDLKNRYSGYWSGDEAKLKKTDTDETIKNFKTSIEYECDWLKDEQ